MAHKITELKSVTPEVAAKLSEAKIKTTEDLLAHTTTTSERNALAKQLGVTTTELIDWINRADLMRLKGVGYDTAHLLEECGIDSCKELQHRKAENLFNKLKTTNDEQKLTNRTPTQAQVETWITEAAAIVAAHVPGEAHSPAKVDETKAKA